MSTLVEKQLHATLAGHLEQIAKLYKERPRLTLIVRVPGKPDQGVYLSDDNWPDAVGVVEYLRGGGAQYIAGPDEPAREGGPA